MIRKYLYFAFILLSLLLSSCNYHLDRSGNVSPVQNPIQKIPTGVDFAAVQQAVFIPHCQKCHGFANVFTFENYDLVFSKLSKIEHRVFVTNDMPPGGLNENGKALLKEWILLGAPL